jgi:hypothetical protein
MIGIKPAILKSVWAIVKFPVAVLTKFTVAPSNGERITEVNGISLALFPSVARLSSWSPGELLCPFAAHSAQLFLLDGLDEARLSIGRSLAGTSPRPDARSVTVTSEISVTIANNFLPIEILLFG